MQNCKSILEKKKPLFNYKKELHLYNVLSEHEETYIKLMNFINSSPKSQLHQALEDLECHMCLRHKP